MGMHKMNEDENTKTDSGNKSTASSTSTVTVLSGDSKIDSQSTDTTKILSGNKRKIRSDKGKPHKKKDVNPKIKDLEKSKEHILHKLERNKQSSASNIQNKNDNSVILYMMLIGLALMFVYIMLTDNNIINKVKDTIKGRKEFYE